MAKMGLRRRPSWFAASLAVSLSLVLFTRALAGEQAQPSIAESSQLRLARQHFYSARYNEAVAAAASLIPSGPEALAAYELRTSALHFELKRQIGDATNKAKALKQCAVCQPLLDAFTKDLTAGKALATAQLKSKPDDELTLFYFGKLDLNYVWLELSTLGKRTGWGEYWNARHSMDAVLKANPNNVRARVARAWIDYIVDTRVPFGMKWMLGGGDRKKALKALTEAAAVNADIYDKAEAEFGLWDMLVRDKRRDDALVVAKRLVKDFPENQDLQRFISK
jgi:tetratricopeptide (TPR) repeat protein